ncbi:MAG: DUF1194 domain-containing protein [Pseudomonadota bacterium]
MRFLLISVFVVWASVAQAACRHALVLALDISGSVDEEEYQLQLNGIAAALVDEEIQDLILQFPQAPIELAIFEWNAPGRQQLLLDWTVLDSEETLLQIAENFVKRPNFGGKRTTALGDAILFSKTLMDERPNCARKTVDISGDGRNNSGPRPWEIYAEFDLNDITVNALAIGQPFVSLRGTVRQSPYSAEALQRYFIREVIHGPDAFAELALGYQDYARAIKRKLIRELSPIHLSRLPYEHLRLRLAGLGN